MRSFSVRPARLILVPSALQSHALVPFRPTSSSSTPPVTYPFTFPYHVILVIPQSHTLLPFHFIQHFVPPLRFFSPCPRPPGKVPGFSAKTVHFPPWPAGVPAPQASLAALAVSPSRESAGNFGENGSLSPRGRQGHRLHMPLWRHLPFPPLGKVPGFPAKMVHFPPWPTGTPAPQASLAALGISTPGESAGNFGENGSLSPVA